MIIKKSRNEIHAEKIGQAVANGLFKDMLDPSNQGDSFSWDSFPEIFSDLAERQIFMGFKYDVKGLDNLKAIGVAAYVEEGNKLKTEYMVTNILPIKSKVAKNSI